VKAAELVLTSGSAVFGLALVPALIRREGPPRSTSVTTGLGLLAYAAAYVALGLPFAAASSGLLGAEWLILAIVTTRGAGNSAGAGRNDAHASATATGGRSVMPS
jgi:hypothetical protein